MKFNRNVLPAVAVAVGLTFGLGAPLAVADPTPAPVVGEVPPAWAPPKPAESWQGQPIVWYSGWGGRWGVWLNGAFMPLSSNPVTGGG